MTERSAAVEAFLMQDCSPEIDALIISDLNLKDETDNAELNATRQSLRAFADELLHNDRAILAVVTAVGIIGLGIAGAKLSESPTDTHNALSGTPVESTSDKLPLKTELPKTEPDSHKPVSEATLPPVTRTPPTPSATPKPTSRPTSTKSPPAEDDIAAETKRAKHDRAGAKETPLSAEQQFWADHGYLPEIQNRQVLHDVFGYVSPQLEEQALRVLRWHNNGGLGGENRNGDPNSFTHNPDGSVNRGLMEIHHSATDYLRDYRSDILKGIGLTSDEDLFDPVINAKVGLALVYVGHTWKYWYGADPEIRQLTLSFTDEEVQRIKEVLGIDKKPKTHGFRGKPIELN